jgi:hypothetical protein
MLHMGRAGFDHLAAIGKGKETANLGPQRMLVDEAVVRSFEQWAAYGMTGNPLQVTRLILREKIIGLQIQISHYDFQIVKRKPWDIDAAAASRPAADKGEQDVIVSTFYL